MFNLGDTGGIFTGVIVYAGMILAAFWLAMIIWTYRDMRARSRDALAQIVVAVMVAVLTVLSLSRVAWLGLPIIPPAMPVSGQQSV